MLAKLVMTNNLISTNTNKTVRLVLQVCWLGEIAKNHKCWLFLKLVKTVKWNKLEPVFPVQEVTHL